MFPKYVFSSRQARGKEGLFDISKINLVLHPVRSYLDQTQIKFQKVLEAF